MAGELSGSWHSDESEVSLSGYNVDIRLAKAAGFLHFAGVRAGSEGREVRGREWCGLSQGSNVCVQVD